MTVRELLNRMDSAEFTEWMIYNELEPIGDDWRPQATVAAVIANANSTGKSFSADDFLPIRQEQQSKELTAQQLIAWAKGYGNRNKS